MAWTNQALILFHGCAASALQPVNPGGIGTADAPHNIQLPLCRPLTDFGRGFYTTTYEHQAKQWANAQVRRVASSSPVAPLATVIRFQVDRDELAKLKDLVFVLYNADYYDLVDYCRADSAPHARMASGNLRRLVEYDVVYGPVSALQQSLVIKGCDQVSLHTLDALNILPSPDIHLQGNPWL